MILNSQFFCVIKEDTCIFFLIWASCRLGGMRVALVTSGATSSMMDFHHNMLSEIKITITFSQILRTLYLSTIRTCLHSLFIRISICFNSGHFFYPNPDHYLLLSKNFSISIRACSFSKTVFELLTKL